MPLCTFPSASSMPRIYTLNPKKLFVRTAFGYEKLPASDSQSSSPIFSTPITPWKRHHWTGRWRRPRLSLTRVMLLTIALSLVIFIMGTAGCRRHKWNQEQKKKAERKKYHWEFFPAPPPPPSLPDSSRSTTKGPGLIGIDTQRPWCLYSKVTNSVP